MRSYYLAWFLIFVSPNVFAAFETFDYGSILERVEAIKSQRLRNELLQKEIQGQEINQQQDRDTSYKEGYADGYNNGRKLAERETMDIRRESLDKLAFSILIAMFKEDREQFQNDVFASIAQYPNAYWLKAMSILIEHRLAEI